MDDIVATYVKDLLNLRVAHYLSAGATALAIWDWLICLELEYRFIWKARLSAGKFLYLIHRYPLIIISVIGIHFNTACDIPISRCKIWVPVEYCFDILVVAFVQVTLLLRVYALYEKNRCVVMFLSILFCVSLATTLSFYGVLIRKFYYYPTVSPLVGCLPDCNDCYSWIPAVHLPLLLFDTIVLGFTLKKCLHFFSKERSLLPTLTIVFRDGLIYYVATFAMMIFNIVFLYLTPASMSYWFIPWMRSIVAIMGTRLLLNLRGQIEAQRLDETGFMFPTVDLNDSAPHYSLQPTTPSTAHSPMTWRYGARRANRMSAHDHDPQDDDEGEGESVPRESGDVTNDGGVEVEMTRVRGSWKAGSSSKTEAGGSEPETPTPPPPWRRWKKCPHDNPTWL